MKYVPAHHWEWLVPHAVPLGRMMLFYVPEVEATHFGLW